MQRLLPNSAVAESEPSPEDIRVELNRVLASSEFRATPQRRQMLRYLVEETLAGRSDRLKGYSIGIEVFRRDEGFDSQADPVVRLEARRLRHDLDSYYVSEGRRNPLRITIPTGRYIPDFVLPEPQPDQRSATPAEGFAPVLEAVENAPAPATSRFRWLAAAALACIMIAAALGYVFLNPWRPWADSDAAARGPALAVLPFEALSNNRDDSFLAAGVAREIVHDLNRFPDFRLFDPPAGSAESAVADPADIARRLGVTYLISGSVRSEVSSVSINVRLVDARSGQILWTESYSRPLNPGALLAVQGEIADAIASTLGQPYGVIRNEITARLADQFVPSMPSYECVLRGYSYRRSFARELHAPVLSCLESAVKRDPEYAEAWAMLGWLHLDAGRFGYAADGDIESAYDRALEAASNAVTLDGKNVLALKALSSINHYMGHYVEGERFARQALEINPNDPDSLAQLGWRLAARGKFDDGIPYLMQAIERTVSPPGWYFHFVAVDHYLHGRYAEMLTAAEIGAPSKSTASWSLIAIAHGALGNGASAREALAKMAEISPELARDPAAFYRRHGTIDNTVDALVSGLRKAGWPEAVRSSPGG